MVSMCKIFFLRGLCISGFQVTEKSGKYTYIIRWLEPENCYLASGNIFPEGTFGLILVKNTPILGGVLNTKWVVVFYCSILTDLLENWILASAVRRIQYASGPPITGFSDTNLSRLKSYKHKKGPLLRVGQYR